MMKERRLRQLTFRATEEEAAVIKKKIEQSGLSQQQYLLGAALGAKIINTEGIERILPELSRVGNNLNQLARAKNSGGYGYNGQLLEKNQKELETLWQQLKRYLQGHR